MKHDFTVVRCDDPRDTGWLALRLELYPDHGAPTLLSEMAACCRAREEHATFLARTPAGELLGFVEASLRHDPVWGTRTHPVAFLESLYVVPSARRHGIARALVRAAEGWGAEHGCTEFATDVLLENAAGQLVQRALGYEETRRVVFFRKGPGRP